MATVRQLISLLLFLLAADFLASNAWPVASGPPGIAIPSQVNFAIPGINQQPISKLSDGLPIPANSSTPDNSRGASQISILGVAGNASSPIQEDAVAPKHSSSQSNNGSLSQLYSRDFNYNKPISNSHSVVEQPVRPHREIPLVASPSKHNSSELRSDKTPSLENDRLIEGSGMGPVHGFQGREAKSKLDDTEESDDDDEDYDETLDTGSGHSNLSNKPSSPLPSNSVVVSAQSELRERPQQSDFYKPFRPPPPLQPASSSPGAGLDNHQRRPNSYASETVSSPVAAREAPAQVTFVAKNVTVSFPVTTPAPPRVPSIIPTLVTPALSRSDAPAAHNRTKSETDYEDEEENEDEDDGETSAFEDNDTSEADNVAPRQPTPSTKPSPNLVALPFDKANHASRPPGLERPLNASAPSSSKHDTFITRPVSVTPSTPPAISGLPMTPPPTVRPAPQSVTPSAVDDQVDEEEVEEDDEEEEEEEEDDELSRDDLDSDDQYPVNVTRPILGPMDNQPQRPLNVPLKPATMQTVQNHVPWEQTTTTSSTPHYPSQYNKRPTSAPMQAPGASSPHPPRLAAPVNHQAPREPHYVTTVMPTTRMPTATLTPATAPPISKLIVPIVSSQLPPANTGFVPANYPPSHKPPPILNGATSVTTTTTTTSQQLQPPIIVPTTRGHQQQQHTTGLVNPAPPLQPAKTTTVTPQDKPRSHFTTLEPRPQPAPPTMQFAPGPTNRGVDVAAGQTNRALRDNNVVAVDDTLTKQIYDKAVEVYHEADKTVRAAWEAIWPPNMNYDSASIEPLLTQPLFFMLALGGAIICLVLLMMLVVYIISYQIQPKVDDDISIY